MAFISVHAHQLSSLSASSLVSFDFNLLHFDCHRLRTNLEQL